MELLIVEEDAVPAGSLNDRLKLEVVQSSPLAGPLRWAPVYVGRTLCGALWHTADRAGWISRSADDQPTQALVGDTGAKFTERLVLAQRSPDFDPAAFVAYWQDHPGATTGIGDTRPAASISDVQAALR